MIMQKQPNWAEWFINNPNNEAGNNNLQAFSDVLGSEVSTEAKIRDLVDQIDTVILIADANRNIMLLHSPKYFGGTRSRPDNKVSCMIGLGARATSVFPVLILRIFVLLSRQSKNFQDANQLKTLKTFQRSIRMVKKVSKARQYSSQAQFSEMPSSNRTQETHLSSFSLSIKQHGLSTKNVI